MRAHAVFLIMILSVILLLSACVNEQTQLLQNGTDNTVGTGKTDNPQNTDPDVGNEAEEEADMITDIRSFMKYTDKTPYAVPVGTDKYALTGPVGTDENRMNSEVLYPAPSDEDCAEVVYFADYGMNESNSGEDNYAAFLKAMQRLNGVDGVKKAVFPSGKIRISQTVPLGGYRDLYIVGNSTTVVMESWTSMSYSRDCDGLHFNDLTLDYLYSPIVWGTIDGFDTDKGVITVAVDKSFDMANPIYGINNGGVHRITGYYEMTESENGKYKILPDKTIRYGAQDSCRLNSISKNTVDVMFAEGALPDEPVIGDRVNLVFCQYDACALNFTYCKNVYIEHFTIHKTSGMGLVITYSENAYVNHLDIHPDETSGLTLATSADGIHTIRLAGTFNLTNSVLTGIQDDCLNVCTTYDRVASIKGNMITFTPVDESTAIKAGHTVEIYDPSTWKMFGSYTVTDVNGTTLTLDREADAGIKSGYAIGNVSTATVLTVDNCLFSSSMGRGGLIQSRDTTISHCSFMDLVHPGLRIHAVNDMFREGIVPADITVRDCKFVNCNLFPFYDSIIEVMAYDQNTGMSSMGAIRRISIENNYFSHSAGNAVSLKGVGDSSVRHNLICDMLNDPLYNYCVTIGGMMMNAAVGISYTDNTVISDNYIYSPKTYSEYTDVLCDPDTTENITVENNTSDIDAGGIFNSLFMDFSSTQGKGGFSYMKRRRNGTSRPLSWQAADNLWRNPDSFTIISRDTMHPDELDPALVYTVPKSGTWVYYYSIQPVDIRSDGVGIAVLVNDRDVVSGENGYLYVKPMCAEKGTLTLELNEGDEITLLLNKWGTNSYDSCNVRIYARLD